MQTPIELYWERLGKCDENIARCEEVIKAFQESSNALPLSEGQRFADDLANVQAQLDKLVITRKKIVAKMKVKLGISMFSFAPDDELEEVLAVLVPRRPRADAFGTHQELMRGLFKVQTMTTIAVPVPR